MSKFKQYIVCQSGTSNPFSLLETFLQIIQAVYLGILFCLSESHGLPKQPPLELAIGQTTECMKLMSKAGIGSCAFASINDYLH
jgi:hypothetical protein